MGYGLDEGIEFDDGPHDDELRERLAELLWTGKDGSVVPLHKMQTRHIQNSIRRIERTGSASCWGYGYDWLPKLRAELALRHRSGRP